jgi:hypothetical protein
MLRLFGLCHIGIQPAPDFPRDHFIPTTGNPEPAEFPESSV